MGSDQRVRSGVQVAAVLTLAALALALGPVLRSDAAEGVSSVGTFREGAVALAAAMSDQRGLVTDAWWAAGPPSGDAHGIARRSLGRFPRTDDRFAVMTTGSINGIDDPDHFASVDHGAGPPTGRGDTARDVTVLRMNIDVPTGHNCLRFDFAFFSEEYPEFIGSQFNDGFIAEIGESTWTTSGSEVIAPRNFAHPLDAPDEVVSVNTIGVGWSATEAADLAYGGGTVPLTASTPIEPGGQVLYLSIFDQGDGFFDSAVFIEDLRTTTVLDEEQCRSGAAPSIERPLVLLPGIMGSYLGIDGGGIGNRRWPSSQFQILDAALLPDGETTVAGNNVDVMRGRGANGMIERAYGIRLGDTYGTMVSFYEDRGYVLGETLFPYGTDWRLAPALNAERLWQWLEDEGVFDAHDSVDIIAHSQGGLVAHDAIAQEDVAGRAGSERVEHLVAVGTPWYGSAEMSSILLYGEPCKVSAFGRCVYVRSAASIAIRHMPGALQLLPTDNYPRIGGEWNAFVDRDRDAELLAYADQIGDPGRPLLYQAVADASARNRARAFEEVDTLHLVGSGLSTTAQIEEVRFDPCSWYQRGRFCDEPDDVIDSRFERGVGFARTTLLSGDGTVIVPSAQMGVTGTPTLPDVRRAYVLRDAVGDDAGHAQMVRFDGVLEYARQFLSGTLPAPRSGDGASTAAMNRTLAEELAAAGIDETHLSDERRAWLASSDRVRLAEQDEPLADPVPGISEHPATLSGVTVDLTVVGTATISDGAGTEVEVDVPSPFDEPIEPEGDDPPQTPDPEIFEALEAIAELEGMSISVQEGRLSLFVYDEPGSDTGDVLLSDTDETGTETAPSASAPVEVRLDPEFSQEIGMELGRYQEDELQRVRVLPQTLVESEDVTIELSRDGDLPGSVRVGGEEVALGPELLTDTLPPLPTSTANRRLSVLGPPTVEVTAHVDGDDTVAVIEWRTDLQPEWQRLDGDAATLGPFSEEELVWVRAITAAGFTEAPAHRIDLTAPPAVSDVCADVSPISFGDGAVIAAVHRANVTCMASYGITVGVDDVPNFAPGREVTRQEMATFIARLLRVATTGSTDLPTLGEDTAEAAFSDVLPGSVHAPAIAWLASIGVTSGVTDERFAPGEPVTRQQMATFIARAQRYLGAFEDDEVDDIITASGATTFTDLSTAAPVHRPSIALLSALEVVEGLPGGGFGPGQSVTRQQMAAFVVRTAALLATLDRWDALRDDSDTDPGTDPEAPGDDPDPDAPGDDPAPEVPGGDDATPELDDPTITDVLPGVDAEVAAYRTGAWSTQGDGDGWQRIAYQGESAHNAALQVRRLPGWWAAEALIDAFETGQAWFQGFDNVEVTTLVDDPRFPDAEQVVEIRSTVIANIGGPTFDGGPWAWGDDRRYLIDHGDHVVEIAWESLISADRWQPAAEVDVVDPAGLAVTDSLHVRAAGTSLLPQVADPRDVEWGNTTITYRPDNDRLLGVDGAATDVKLVRGEFQGVAADGTPLELRLRDIAYGDATSAADLEALLIFESSASDNLVGLVMTRDREGEGADQDHGESAAAPAWRQIDTVPLGADTQRLIAVREMVFTVTPDGMVSEGMFSTGDVFSPVQ